VKATVYILASNDAELMRQQHAAIQYAQARGWPKPHRKAGAVLPASRESTSRKRCQRSCQAMCCSSLTCNRWRSVRRSRSGLCASLSAVA
jgi:hypothetical protein